MRTLSHVFFLDPSPVRRVPIPTGIQRKLNFVSVRTIKGLIIKTKDLRIVYGMHDTHGLVIYGFSDSDWGADPDSYRSTGASCE